MEVAGQKKVNVKCLQADVLILIVHAVYRVNKVGEVEYEALTCGVEEC